MRPESAACDPCLEVAATRTGPPRSAATQTGRTVRVADARAAHVGRAASADRTRRHPTVAAERASAMVAASVSADSVGEGPSARLCFPVGRTDRQPVAGADGRPPRHRLDSILDPSPASSAPPPTFSAQINRAERISRRRPARRSRRNAAKLPPVPPTSAFACDQRDELDPLGLTSVSSATRRSACRPTDCAARLPVLPRCYRPARTVTRLLGSAIRLTSARVADGHRAPRPAPGLPVRVCRTVTDERAARTVRRSRRQFTDGEGCQWTERADVSAAVLPCRPFGRSATDPLAGLCCSGRRTRGRSRARAHGFVRTRV